MDSNDWPEPIVPVQSISDSCTHVIPDQYIQPPSQRPSPDLIKNVNIPIIDFHDLTTGDGKMVEYCPATVKEISDACREWGFFQAVNHGLSHELLHRVKDVWRQFFHLPMVEKRKYSNSPINYEGYGSRLGIEKKAILDWGDYYFLHILPTALKDHSKWPSVPPSTTDTVEEYGKEAVKFCRMVMRALSLSLGLDVGKLEQSFEDDSGDGVGSCLRVNFYPKCPQPDLTLGLSPHSDPGGLTLLLTDDHVQGLQFRREDGWGTIRSLPDAFIVNVGDQIQASKLLKIQSHHFNYIDVT